MNEKTEQGRETALSGVDLRPKRDPPGSRDGDPSAEEIAQGAAPREPIFVCQGCGAIGQESGKVLDAECRCKEPEPTKHAEDCLLNFKGATPKPKRRNRIARRSYDGDDFFSQPSYSSRRSFR